jgi:D-serine deaminase-like pyridoxal phosphate-dependent protein
MLPLETPALLLHADVVEHNLAQMAARARTLGVALRPHAKTHKCVTLGRRQLALGAIGLTVATLAEAEAFTDAGVEEILWAFPIDPTHLPRARSLAARTRLGVVTDDLTTARALGGSGLAVWLKVDCGYGRAGVNPNGAYALEVAGELARERGITFAGILSHAGHAYHSRSRAEAAAVAESERAVMVAFAEKLRRAGMPVRSVSVGSTPAMAAVERLDGVTEARPGNYVFYDRTMVQIGACGAEDVGVTVLASVVSHQPGAAHFVVNAGALALSKDTGPAHVGGPVTFGALREHPDLTFVSVSQEHGVIRAAAPDALEGRFPVGSQVEIVPNHSCLTVAQFDHYDVVRGDQVVDQWAISRAR